MAHAQDCARAAAADPVTAVHRYRKALRRARALIRLARSFLGTQAHGKLSNELRSLHRITSAQRDRDVVLSTLESLDLAARVPALTENLRNATAPADTMSPESVVEILRQGATRLDPLPDTFAAALPDRVTWRDLARAIRKSYQRARRKMQEAHTSGHDDGIHEWRKRTKELNYQTELLTSVEDSGTGRERHRQFANLAEKLGKIIDLMVLEEFVRERATADERERVLKAIKRTKKKRLKRTFKSGARIVEEKPKVFARQMIEATRSVYNKTRGVGDASPTSSRAKAAEEQTRAIHEPDTAAHEPDTTAHEPDTTAHEPDTTAHEPDTAAHEPDTTAHEPDTTAHEPDTTVETMSQAEVAGATPRRAVEV
ncbi:MAG: CHAD domain-containing protein [Proteobacteria bacterium]|nr:CHAD domain-containing protein [Pseudomonadota bacterium]